VDADKIRKLFKALQAELGNELILVYKLQTAEDFVTMSSNSPAYTKEALSKLVERF
jgi:hypothetical protein